MVGKKVDSEDGSLGLQETDSTTVIGCAVEKSRVKDGNEMINRNVTITRGGL